MYKIAVITPYYKESVSLLQQCHTSVTNQIVNASVTHFLIADGYPLDEIKSWHIEHMILPQSHDDNGNTPRGLGSLRAKESGYDFIAYLDADNWFHENHLQSMFDKWLETKSNVICSYRTYHQINGEEISIEEIDENSFYHVDTSCFFIHKNAFDIIDVWLKMPKRLSPLCDRIFFAAIKWKDHSIAFTKLRTVAFRSQYKFHYIFGQIKTNHKLKPLDCLKPAFDYLVSREGIAITKLSLGFHPSTYLKSRNILFVSDFNSELSAIATIYLSALCTRFIPQRAYLEPHHREYHLANCLAREKGLPEIDTKKNKWIDDYQTSKSPPIDYIFLICHANSKKMNILLPGNPKIIFWELSQFEDLDGNEVDSALKFKSQALEIELRIKHFFSLTDYQIDAL